MVFDRSKFLGSIINNLSDRFFRLNIAKKLMIGYLSLAVLIILISIFALSNLRRLNNINESILKTDVPVIDATDKMIDNLLAQELYMGRYAILKSSDMLVLFWQRSEEFNQIAEQILLLPGQDKFPIKELTSLHDQYNYIVMEGIEYIGKGTHIAEVHNSRIKKKQLKAATKQIAEGRFDYKHNTQNQDELGELSNAFDEMARRLKRLEEMYIDASPLTRLPGGIAIENILQKRLDSGIPLAFCLLDLDNFKAFNDRYGYAMGSEVIKATARIIEEVISNKGTEEEFIGHIGGGWVYG